MSMLIAKNITKKFGKLEVLKGVSLEVSKGEVIAVIGSSGSGKSTFLRCMNHLEKVDGGTILLDGEPLVQDGTYVAEKTIRRLCRKTGMVFQSFNLFPHMSVIKNITQRECRAQIIYCDAAQDGNGRVMGEKGSGMLHRHEMSHEQVQVVMYGDVTVFPEKKKNRRLSQNGGSEQEPVPFFYPRMQPFLHSNLPSGA